MRREHRPLAHYVAPVLFLLAVTIVVLIVHGGFSGGTRSSSPTSSTHKVTTTSATTSTLPAKTRSYTIRSGDTFGSIAIHFGVSVDDLTALNPDVEPTALRVGQRIKVGKAPAGK
jgi:LysM repeat protein